MTNFEIHNEFEIVKGDVMIVLEDLGEGWDGDYNEEDPLDEPLLRFSCYVRGDLLRRYQDQAPYDVEEDQSWLPNGEWSPLSNSSYCTQLNAEMEPHLKRHALEMLMGMLYDPIDSLRPKKACEEASWIETCQVKESFAVKGGRTDA